MRKINLSKFFSFILFLSFLLLFFNLRTKPTFAFEEEFNNSSLDPTIWQVYQNGGRINISDGAINISAENTSTFPFIYSKNNPIPTSGNFSLKFRMKYNRITTKGTGLLLATELPPNGAPDPSLSNPVFSRRYFLGIWQGPQSGFYFQYSGDCYNQSCSVPQILVWQKKNQDFDYHTIEFQYLNNRYLIFLDGTNIFTSNPTSIRPTALWFGNPSVQGSGDKWANFEIDYIHIIPSLPSSPSLQPLILLPGLGGSWNHRAMILGEDVPQSEWYMTPGVKVYDGLIETLKNAGYKTEGEDKNLFIFNYNWTKPVDFIADDLENYIQTVVNPPPETKIDLVGHSLGGLVARTYVQNNPNNSIDQLLTLGSPHKGVPFVYYLWEGGNLNKALPGWQRIGAGLLLHLRKPGFSTTMEAVRSVVPVLKDLLPTFDYLRQDTVEKPLETMGQKNEWLLGLNSSPPPHLLSTLNAFVGIIPESTLRWIHIEGPNWLESILGLWEDGKPIGEEKTAGDGTVLVESGHFENATITNLADLDHQDLVETAEGQEKIMEILNLSPSSISTISSDIIYEPSLVFQLASPATISILDSSGNPIGDTDGKMVVIPGALAGEYQVKITGTDSGNYHLHIGQIVSGKDIWTTTSGTISSGEQIIHKINFDPLSPLSDPLINQSGIDYAKSARSKLLDLKFKINQQEFPRATKRIILTHLNRTIRLLDRNKIENSIISIYSLRYKLNSRQLARKLDEENNRYLKNKILEIIEDLERAYINNQTNTYNSARLTREINLAERYFTKMENRLKNLANQRKTKADYGALYLVALEKLEKARSSTSYQAHIKAIGAQYLSREALRFFQ